MKDDRNLFYSQGSLKILILSLQVTQFYEILSSKILITFFCKLNTSRHCFGDTLFEGFSWCLSP